MAKKQTVPFLTPLGTLRYPKIAEPDTKGQFADGKFKTDIVFDEAGVEAVKKKLLEAAKVLHPGVDPKDIKLPIYEWTEGNGTRAKSQYRPLVQDAKTNDMPESTKIGGGTIARLAVAAAGYKKKIKVRVKIDGKMKEVEEDEIGINLYLNKVQIKELHTYGGGQEFDEIEGEEYAGGDEASGDEDSSFDSL